MNCQATMDSPAHFVHRDQSMILFCLEHQLSLVCLLGCQVPEVHGLGGSSI